MRIARALAASASGMASLARLALRGQLLRYWREMRNSASIVRLNLFLAMPGLGGSWRLTARAWWTIGYRMYNDLDFEFLPWRHHEVSGLERLHECLADGRGAIVCTHHFGAYRRVYYELVRRGLEVTLVVDDRVASTLKTATSRLLEARGVPVEEIERFQEGFTVLNAEEPGMVQAFLDALDRNRVLMVYLDGNTGMGLPDVEGAPVNNSQVVEFFGRRIAIRQGACQISYLKQAPIVPLFALWGRGFRPAFTCLPAIRPNPRIPMEEFCRRALQELFSLAECEIRKHPPQFEHWVYVHRWRPKTETGDGSDEDALGAARRDIGALCEQVRYRIHPQRMLIVSIGARRIVADAVRGRMIEAGRLLADVAGALHKELTYEALCARLRGQHSGADILEMLARLKAMGCLLMFEGGHLASSRNG